jgi:acyl-CoA synthetase (NDP forming)
MADDGHSLRPLLAPKSIAIIGASDDLTRIAGRPLRYLLSAGYEGEILPVNPKRATVQGVPAFSSITEVGRPVDCAIISVPSDGAIQAVKECAESGVRSAIVFSAGFAEVGPEGRARQEELTRIARTTGMRILGPNTVGVVNTAINSYQTFSMATESAGTAGRVGMCTQSGGYGSYFFHLARRHGVRFGQWVTTGNECDVEIGEVLHYFAQDPGIDVLMGYVEGIRSRDSFIAALEAARTNGKPVVMLKVGASESGRAAAESHTAALAGADAIYDAVFREYGVHRAHSPEEFLDVAYAASHGKLPNQRSVAVFTTSGGMGVHAADQLTAQGMNLPRIDEAVQRDLLALVPNGSAANPLDTTGQVVNEPGLLKAMLDRVLMTGAFDTALIMLAHSPNSPELAPGLLAVLEPVAAAHPDRLLTLCMAAPPSVLKQFRGAGFMVIEDPGRAAVALGALATFAESFKRAKQEPARAELPAPRQWDGPLNEAQGKALLSGLGIGLPAERTVSSARDIAAAADAVGYPVAVKILSADIAHKTEVGGVAIGLRDAESVEAAAERILESVSRARPDARIDGLLVSRMITGGIECILGVTRDPLFGPVTMFGLGGVAVEVFGDVTFRLAPVSGIEADRMLSEIRSGALLAGHRGKPPADRTALRDAIVALSRFAAANADSLASIEINPLLAMPEGEGIIALDAAVELVTAA